MDGFGIFWEGLLGYGEGEINAGVLFVVVDDREEAVGFYAKFAEFLFDVVVEVWVVERSDFVVDAEFFAVSKLGLEDILDKIIECRALWIYD